MMMLCTLLADLLDIDLPIIQSHPQYPTTLRIALAASFLDPYIHA
jgi:hypothetical protein